MTTKEMLVQLNSLRIAAGKPPLAAWKSSREKLEAAIGELSPPSDPKEEKLQEQELQRRIDEGENPDGFEMSEGELVRLPAAPEAHPELEGRLLHVLGERFASCYDLLLAAEMPDSQYLPATAVLVELEKRGVARSHVHDGECDWALTPEELARRAAEGQEEPTPVEQPAAKPVRGGVKGIVNAMLETDAPYEEIVAAVKAAHPEARTTARSIASMAMDLRRLGVTIPSRRKAAKVG